LNANGFFLMISNTLDYMEGPPVSIIGLDQSEEYLFEWIQNEPGGL